MQRISLLAENSSLSQEDVCYMESRIVHIFYTPASTH